MLALTYTKQIVLAMFLEAQGKVNPSAAEIEQFDADLKAAWDAALVEAMTELGIPVDQPTKSVVLEYAVSAPGDTFPGQARAGCQYYLNTLNL